MTFFNQVGGLFVMEMVYTGVLGSFRLVGDEGVLSPSGSETQNYICSESESKIRREVDHRKSFV